METAPTYSIETTKKTLAAVFKGIETYKLAKENDGKIGIDDLPLFLGYIMSVFPIITNAGKIPHELKDLDLTEARELRTFLVSEINGLVDNDELVNQVDLGLKILENVYELAKTFKKA
jgi:hypothetical protein